VPVVEKERERERERVREITSEKALLAKRV
jgi:hypothetical protein